MKNWIVIISISALFVGCINRSAEEKVIEGFLHYSTFRVGSFYDVQDSIYKKYTQLRDSVGIDSVFTGQEKLTLAVKILEKHDLLKSPYVYLKTDSDFLFIVYMTPEDYAPITKFTYLDLKKNNQKVRLKFVTENLGLNLVLCKKVISIEKLMNDTLSGNAIRRNKFKIEDYRECP